MRPYLSLSQRRCGLLLHPTSLPAPHGIGDLGPEAYKFADFLVASGQTWWQMFPLGPTGLGHSPYQVHSAFAGHTLLISLELLYQDGLLSKSDVEPLRGVRPNEMDYRAAKRFKQERFRWAYLTFLQTSHRYRHAFEEFRHRNREWLEDAGLYFALKTRYHGAPWTKWSTELRERKPSALLAAKKSLRIRIGYQEFLQFIFFRQWEALRKYCQKKEVGLIGDIPIFIAHDSVDVWSHRRLFYLNKKGEPIYVAGTPPDYFSRTGQRWGNPLYRWDVMKKDGYSWWIGRLRHMLELFDAVRLDHFIGFQRYWRIPANHPTAQHGRWVPGPGASFFQSVRKKLGDVQFIAEDLGVIGPDVESLRDRFGFPGMKILQFAFGTGQRDNPFLPHNFPKNCVVYTGTHDNNTTVGWFKEKRSPAEKEFITSYLKTNGRNIHWDMIRAAHLSSANLAMVPVQDILGLPASARMNRPGTALGNWGWRMKKGALTPRLRRQLLNLTTMAGRRG